VGTLRMARSSFSLKFVLTLNEEKRGPGGKKLAA